MEIKIDLQRVLWHEFGHFCIDLIDSFTNNKKIVVFEVAYYRKSISDQKWNGRINTTPSLKEKEMIESIDKTSFTLINYISGCLFETIFFKEIQKIETSYTNCFCPQTYCSGEDDFKKYEGIKSKIRIKYGLNSSFMKYSEIELFETYYENIKSNKSFINSLNILIGNHANKIIKQYDGTYDKDEFHYCFNENEINLLKNKVSEIIIKTSFNKTIEILNETIINKILKDEQNTRN